MGFNLHAISYKNWVIPSVQVLLYLLDQTVNGHTPERDAFNSPYANPQGVYRCIGIERYIAIAVTQDETPLLFARNAEVGALAVLDATTGETLRNVGDNPGLADYPV